MGMNNQITNFIGLSNSINFLGGKLFGSCIGVLLPMLLMQRYDQIDFKP